MTAPDAPPPAVDRGTFTLSITVDESPDCRLAWRQAARSLLGELAAEEQDQAAEPEQPCEPFPDQEDV